MIVQNCAKCGGTHIGSYDCPFTLAPCVVCGDETILACSDCAIELNKSVHVCRKAECRDLHEVEVHGTSSVSSTRRGSQEPQP